MPSSQPLPLDKVLCVNLGLRLSQPAWTGLVALAASTGLTVPQLLRKLVHEALQAEGWTDDPEEGA